MWELTAVICTSIDDEGTSELFPLATSFNKGTLIADAVTKPLRTSRRFHSGLMGPFICGYLRAATHRAVPGKIKGLAPHN